MARRQAQANPLDDPRIKFTLAAIAATKAVNAAEGHPERKGMHVVYSGFNEEFERRFGEQSRTVTEAMEQAGMIRIRGARGGVTLTLAEDAPAPSASDVVKQAIRGLAE